MACLVRKSGRAYRLYRNKTLSVSRNVVVAPPFVVKGCYRCVASVLIVKNVKKRKEAVKQNRFVYYILSHYYLQI